MKRLSELDVELRDITAHISRLERAFIDHQGLESLAVNIESLKKRQRALEGQFLAAADALGVDVCTYKLFGNGEQPTVYTLTSVLLDFQSLVSVVYAAVKLGQRQRERIGAEVAGETSLRFGYTFAGSVGIVMTLPNERLLLGATHLDQAMSTIFEMAKSPEPGKIAEFARRLGPAPIRAMYRWVTDHVQAGLHADIQWRRRDEVRAAVLVQEPELRQLQNAIAITGDETVEEYEITGVLVGADVSRRTFHIQPEGGGDIRGTFVDAISAEQTVELPKRYMATVRKTTRIKYSTEQEEISYVLLAVRRPG